MTDDLRSQLREQLAEAIPTGPQGYCSLHVDDITNIVLEALTPVLEVVEAAQEVHSDAWYTKSPPMRLKRALSNLHTGAKP